MAALRLTYQGRPAIHALEAGGLLSLLAPGVPAHKALHVLDLNIQALGAPLLGLPEAVVSPRVLLLGGGQRQSHGRLPPPSDGAGLLVNIHIDLGRFRRHTFTVNHFTKFFRYLTYKNQHKNWNFLQ